MKQKRLVDDGRDEKVDGDSSLKQIKIDFNNIVITTSVSTQ